MADYIKPVVFRLGKQNFGIDIGLVQSIEREIDVVNVPNAMSYISGIVNLRGEVIPAYSLKKKFLINSEEEGNDAVIVILPNGLKLALEVDEVLEIGDVDPNSIVEMPVLVKTAETQYLDRVVNTHGRLIILLDIVKILTDNEAEQVKEFADKLSEE